MRNEFKLFVIGLMGTALMTSCSQKAEDRYVMNEVAQSEEVMADAMDDAMAMTVFEEEMIPINETRAAPPTAPPNFIASGAASVSNDDGVHKLIRTAHIKLKVKNVATATQQIEDIILKRNGIILKSSITNESPYVQTIVVSKDSACNLYYNNLKATLNLRVPYQQLDSALRQIAPLALMIDYRKVDAEDVTFKLMADRLKKIRLEKKQGRMSNVIASRSGKINDAMNAEQQLDNALAEADQTRIAELITNDRILFSSIHIELYQDVTIHKEIVPHKELNVKAYTPGFGSQIVGAFKEGFSFLGDLTIFIITGWPVWLLIAACVYIFLFIRKKRKQKKE